MILNLLNECQLTWNQLKDIDKKKNKNLNFKANDVPFNCSHKNVSDYTNSEIVCLSCGKVLQYFPYTVYDPTLSFSFLRNQEWTVEKWIPKIILKEFEENIFRNNYPISLAVVSKKLFIKYFSHTVKKNQPHKKFVIQLAISLYKGCILEKCPRLEQEICQDFNCDYSRFMKMLRVLLIEGHEEDVLDPFLIIGRLATNQLGFSKPLRKRLCQSMKSEELQNLHKSIPQGKHQTITICAILICYHLEKKEVSFSSPSSTDACKRLGVTFNRIKHYLK